jgi:hypothetical protein
LVYSLRLSIRWTSKDIDAIKSVPNSAADI